MIHCTGSPQRWIMSMNCLEKWRNYFISLTLNQTRSDKEFLSLWWTMQGQCLGALIRFQKTPFHYNRDFKESVSYSCKSYSQRSIRTKKSLRCFIVGQRKRNSLHISKKPVLSEDVSSCLSITFHSFSGAKSCTAALERLQRAEERQTSGGGDTGGTRPISLFSQRVSKLLSENTASGQSNRHAAILNK